jgi:UDP-glucose 4-epimerase
VSDLAKAHILALDQLKTRGGSGILYVGYGWGESVLEVVDAVGRVSGSEVPVRHAGRRPGDSPALIADNQRIISTLGWAPHFDDLDVIVESALNWERYLASTNS